VTGATVTCTGNGCVPPTVAGLTTTPGAFQTTRKNNSSGFVLKLHPDGSKLDYSTYLGGSTGETGGGIAVDSAGVAYVDGGTSSADFPTTPGAFQTTNSGTNAFFSKLRADGSGLLYSTLLSGPKGQAAATSIAIDSNNAAYLAGLTDSSPPARTFISPPEPVFVAKFDASGNQVYSTSLSDKMMFSFPDYLGAPPESAIAVDNAGAAYVAVGSGNFSYLTSISVTKMNASGSPVYTTSVGPLDFHNSMFGGMAMDNQQNFYLAGVAGSLEDTAGPSPVTIPGIVTTAGAFQPLPLPADNNNLPGPQEIAFVQKFAQSLGQGVPTPNPRLITFFTALQKGTTSSPRTITLFNYGDADLAVNSVSLGGTNASDFAISNNQCGTTLQAGKNCTLLVTFSPAVTQGTRTATVDFSFGGGLASQSTMLSGQAGVPVFQATPSPLDFGSTAVGERVLATVTIMNTGTAPMNLLATPAILGTNSNEFFPCVTMAGSCQPFLWPSSIDAGAKITVPMAFIPSGTGPRSAQMVFQTDVPGTQPTIQLTGNGSPFLIVPQSNSLTILAGQTATYQLTVVSGSNISGSATVSCSGAPPAGSCNPSPASYTATPSGQQVVMLSVNTTAHSGALLPPNRLPNPWSLPAIATVALMLILWRRFRGRALRLAGALALLAIMLSCGGGGGGSSSRGGSGSGGGTPSGSYTIVVTAAVNGTSTSAPLTLTVQ